jgi:hypothetical protein
MNEPGDWLVGAGHVHDGGTKVELYVNGVLSCNSKQIYANRRGGFLEPTEGGMAGMGHVRESKDETGMHISDVALCKDWGSVKKGDKVKVIAYYNDTEHVQMKNPKGKLEGQMGIMFTYLGFSGK